MRVASLLVASSLSVLFFTGCEADLGQCDMMGAKTVVYSAAGTPYYQGQALVQQSCANGVCHALSAVDDARTGAPHGLNFDMAPLTPQASFAGVATLSQGIAKVREEANAMWGAIDDGSMPPGAVGLRSAQIYTYALTKMPVTLDIQSSEGKEFVRNWLACKAPVVAGVTGTPIVSTATEALLPPGQGVTVAATFQSVYDSVLKPSCLTCHKPGGAAPLTSIDFTSVTTAYASLVGKDASATSSCAGKGKLVVPSSCETSVLWEKLAATMPPLVCGSLMPLGAAPISAAARQSICDWIKAGAKP